MFEWLTENERYFMISGEERYFKAYNPKTKKFIIEDENENECGEINIFKTGIEQNIDWYEDWQNKLYTGLIRNDGKIQVHVCSTNSGDNWFLEIYRHKTLLNTNEYSDQIVLLSYVIVCNDEIVGDILTKRHQKYGGCAIDDENDFSNWIEEQIEKVSEFNNTEHWDTPCNCIVFAEGLCSGEEFNLLYDMFNKATA